MKTLEDLEKALLETTLYDHNVYMRKEPRFLGDVLGLVIENVSSRDLIVKERYFQGKIAGYDIFVELIERFEYSNPKEFTKIFNDHTVHKYLFELVDDVKLIYDWVINTMRMNGTKTHWD